MRGSEAAVSVVVIAVRFLEYKGAMGTRLALTLVNSDYSTTQTERRWWCAGTVYVRFERWNVTCARGMWRVRAAPLNDRPYPLSRAYLSLLCLLRKVLAAGNYLCSENRRMRPLFLSSFAWSSMSNPTLNDPVGEWDRSLFGLYRLSLFAYMISVAGKCAFESMSWCYAGFGLVIRKRKGGAAVVDRPQRTFCKWRNLIFVTRLWTHLRAYHRQTLLPAVCDGIW
jgi:hypothetical protein